MSFFSIKAIDQKPHHLKKEISGTRAKYRDGIKETAVKAYTVSQESNYLLIQGVPMVGAANDLKYLCEQYGEAEIHHIDEYHCEDFTEAYLVKYSWFPAARTAKKHLDDKSFFGHILHVCYAPEYETVEETSQKLQERRKYVSMQLREGNTKRISKQVVHSNNSTKRNVETMNDCSLFSRNVSHGDKDICSHTAELNQPVTYIWAGKEYTVYPQSASCSMGNMEKNFQKQSTSKESFIPRSLLYAKKSTQEDELKTVKSSVSLEKDSSKLQGSTSKGNEKIEVYAFSSQESFKKQKMW